MTEQLKISFLGGVGEIGKNMTALEYGGEIIVVDAGATFPNEEMPGVDLVIPDTAYLKNNYEKIKGIVLTHGHEDHIGALPFVLKDIKVPIFGTRLTLALLENKFKEHNNRDIMANTVKPGSIVKLGKNFSVEFIKVNHSIAGSCALAITTPVGVVFHTGDFKIDYTPVDGAIIDLPRIAELGRKGVLLLMADSTNVERPGYTMSETTVGLSLNTIFNENTERRIFVATFASNIHRLQQIIDLAVKYNRKVAFSGRSMLNVADCAMRLGELHIDKDILVDVEKTSKIPDKQLVIITTGSQGEPMSALTRMASDDFNKIKIGVNDTIIISASAIPGNEKLVTRVINNLYRKGAKVIYEALEQVHVSGHACREELKLIHSLTKPKFFLPVHGEYRHLKQHAELAEKIGMNAGRILLPDIGMQVLLTKDYMKTGDNIPAGFLLVDGLGVGDVGSVVLRDRKHLSEDGIIVVVVVVNTLSFEVTGLDVISRGFVYMKEADGLMEEARDTVKRSILDIDLTESHDEFSVLKSNIRKDLKNFIFKRTKRNPMVLPIIIES